MKSFLEKIGLIPKRPTLAHDLIALHFEAASYGSRRPWIWSGWER